MANSEDKFKSLNHFLRYSRSDGVFNLLWFVFQWILNIVVHLLYMGTCTATEKHQVSKLLEQACLFLAAFTGSWSYLSLRNTQTALRPLENWMITARHVHTHIWGILSTLWFGKDVAHTSVLEESCSGESAELKQRRTGRTLARHHSTAVAHTSLTGPVPRSTLSPCINLTFH